MISEIKINRENMLNAASHQALMATDLAEELVRNGMPFRTAHHRVGSLVKWCADNRKKLDELTLEEMQITIPEATSECLTLFSPVSSVNKRNITGGTGPDEVAGQLKFWTGKLSEV
jgi:argininosuccinate lyase